MRTTERFDRAVEKLYTAFHEGELNAMDCKHCAVGNMCDNTIDWLGDSIWIGNPNRINTSFDNKTGYSAEELNAIESLFIYGVKTNKERPKFLNNISSLYVKKGIFTKEEQKELQFKGLCAVIGYLCELDGITNVMNYTKLFEYNEKGATNKLKSQKLCLKES